MANAVERPVQIGVLGCGPIAQAAHFDAVRRARNASLYAICDLADDLRERMAVVHQPDRAYSSYDEMLADPEVEAVIVAIADQFHVAMAERALSAGKHVLVEKPIGVSVEEVEALSERARQSDLIVQVGSMKRFDPGIAFARDFIRDEMGDMLALKAWYCDSTHRYTLTDNVQPLIMSSASAKRPPGNPKADKERYYLLGHGSHLVDTARFLGGDMVSIRARHAERFGAHSWFVDIEFATGAMGHLDLTIAVRMDWHEGFHVYGESGSVVGKTYNPWLLKASDVECFSERTGEYTRPLGMDAHVYRLQVEAFADAIRTGADTGAAFTDDGVAAVRALVAIQRSIRSGDWVRLDAVSGSV